MSKIESLGARPVKGTVIAFAACLCTATATQQVRAANIFYNDVGGTFTNGPSWVGGVAPNILDSAIFDTSSAGIPITFVQFPNIDNLQVRDDTVTFDLDGRFLNTLNPGTSLLVGFQATTASSATFTSSQSGGQVNTADVLIQAAAGANASMLLDGSNFTLNQIFTSAFNIGDNLGGGGSSLTIDNGATLITGNGGMNINASGSFILTSGVYNANGAINVNGGNITGLSGSTWNWASNSTFSVSNGGTAEILSNFTSPTNSQFQVDGAGSLVFGSGTFMRLTDGASLSVTNGGSWTKDLNIESGTNATADGAGSSLGHFSIPHGTVTLTNNASASASDYNIGTIGGVGQTGTLNIFSGSTVTDSAIFGIGDISSGSVSSGVVNIDGAGSLLDVVSANIGKSSGSSGTINLTNGGTLNYSNTAVLNNTGTVNVGSGGVLGIDNNFNFNSGTLNVTSGGTVNTSGNVLVDFGTMDVQAGGTLNLDNDLIVAGGTFRRSGAGNLNLGSSVNFTVSNNGLAEFSDAFSNLNYNSGGILKVDGSFDGGGTASELDLAGDLTLSGGSLLNIVGGGVVTVGDQLNVNTNGLVLMNSNATLDVTGDINVNGGGISGVSGSNFTWAAGQTMTIQNGGSVNSFDSSFVSPAGSSFVVAGPISNVTGSGSAFELDNASSITVSNGGIWTKQTIVSGGSVVTANNNGSTLGDFNVIDGSVTLADDAAASGSIFNVGEFGSGTAVLNVQSGASLTSSNIFNLSQDNLDSDGEVYISGAGSSVQTNASTIGSNLTGTGLVDVSNGGSFIVTGATALRQTGTININGGTVLLGDLLDESGTINFNSGTFGLNGDLLIGPGGRFGANVSTGLKNYVFGGTVTVEPGASLTMNGGKMSAGSLQNFGSFAFNSGTLELTSDDLEVDFGGLLGRTPTIVSDQDLVVTNDVNVSSVGLLTVSGGTVTAGTLHNSGIVELTSLTSLIDGGTVANSGTLFGSGLVDSVLTNHTSGVVRAEAGDNLVFNAAGNTNSGTVDNLEGTVQFTGSLTNSTTGIIASRGALRLLGGLTNDGNVALDSGTNDVFGNIVNNASGSVSVANSATASFFGTVNNEGDVFVGSGSRTAFFNHVSGSGSFSGAGTVEFTDGFSPGSSPGIVSFGGDVEFTNSTGLEIELGGTTAGTEYDQLSIVGDIALDGTLDVLLINGFTPGIGAGFDIITAGSPSGTFGTVNLPTLPGSLTFDLVYHANGVTLDVVSLLTGDLDGDGFVGINDLNIVLANWNQNVPPANPLADPSGDGFVGIDDLNAVLGNWNAGTPPDTLASIPEPATLGVTLVSLSVLLRRTSGHSM